MFLSRLLQMIVAWLRRLFGLPGGDEGEVHRIRCRTTTEERSEAEVGPEGGTVEVAGHRLRLEPGSVGRPVKFTIVLRVGDILKVDVLANGQHSFKFEKPALLTLSYARCEEDPPQNAAIYKLNPESDAVEQDLGGKIDREERSVTTSLRSLSRYTIGWP